MTIAFSILDIMIFNLSSETILGMFTGAYALAVLMPTFAVAFRRLHDSGRSGWWFLISFVPIIGIIVLFVFLLLDSQPGENQYGPSPKGS